MERKIEWFSHLVSKLSCKTGLKPNIIDREIFDREIALCKKLSAENNGECGWGKCKDCGVLPLLIKLHKGKLLEAREEISKIKAAILPSP